MVNFYALCEWLRDFKQWGNLKEVIFASVSHKVHNIIRVVHNIITCIVTEYNYAMFYKI